jgi:hypothetical protein
MWMMKIISRGKRMKQENILKSMKTEHNLYMERLNNTPIVDLNLIEYLRASIESHKDKSSLCIGWDYLENNLTERLKHILNDYYYWEKTYNSDKVDYILSDFLIIAAEKYNLNDELKKQLRSFVYVWNEIKRECDKKEMEQNLKMKLKTQGYKEFNPIISKGKELDGKRVKCVMDINAIGIMGSFDKKIAKEGRLCYSEYQDALMFMPKRCRTRGHIIRKIAYYKEVE